MGLRGTKVSLVGSCGVQRSKTFGPIRLVTHHQRFAHPMGLRGTKVRLVGSRGTQRWLVLGPIRPTGRGLPTLWAS